MRDLLETSDAKPAEGMIVCENSRGAEIHGTLLRLTRHEISFEIYSAADMVQMSEVLANLRIFVREQPVYSGRAVITGLVNTGPVLVCQASLEDSWLEVNVLALAKEPARLGGAFSDLIRNWQKVYRIHPAYKLAIADIQSFLFELNHWVNEVQLGISTGNGKHLDEERAAVDELIGPVTPCLNHLFEEFELVSRNVAPQEQPVHGLYAKRQLHSLLLCSPFMHRIYRKPLGYAGDYEMVNMILREPHEGSTLFAKVLNKWFLSQVPAAAHRNRVGYLAERLEEESRRGGANARPMRVLNLGCGPAKEVGDFMARSAGSDRAEFTLLDFNDETLAYAQQTLEAARRRHHRGTRLNMVRKSIGQVIKSGTRNAGIGYDVIYCAGLFDYLPDRVCQQLLNITYDSLAPGGLLLATNVDPSNPIRNVMGDIFEWWLIERDAGRMRALSPGNAPPEDCKLTSDPTGCNVFLEVRKPETTP